MRWGIRTQILLTLAIVLAFGLVASYVVTSRVTRSAVIEGRIQQARNVAALAAERFAGVPTEGLAMAETLARVRPLARPDLVFVLGPDMRPIVDLPAERRRFGALVAPSDLVPYHHKRIRHGVIRSRHGEALLVVMAPISTAPRRMGRSTLVEPTAVCLLAPLSETLEEVERIEGLYLLFTLVILAMALLLGYVLLGRFVVKPVQILKRSVERVGGGVYTDDDDDPGASGELGQLFRSFRRMTDQLARDRRRIQSQITELELANEEIASTQEQLVQSEKLASVGELAAGIAHEIGNPIAVLQGYLEMLADGDLPESTREAYVARMRGSVTRIADIIRELLDFSRPTAGSELLGDAVLAARSAINLCMPQKRFGDVELVADLPHTPMPVAIPAGRIEQVLLNLLFNAADASQPGGQIRVSVDRREGLVRIHVADDGDGIDEEGMRRLFDPFYTTKEPGSGTGLGLAVCYGIVQACGGDIGVQSTAGEGATFTVSLPEAEGTTAEKAI